MKQVTLTIIASSLIIASFAHAEVVAPKAVETKPAAVQTVQTKEPKKEASLKLTKKNRHAKRAQQG